MEFCVNCGQSEKLKNTEHGPLCVECYHAFIQSGVIRENGLVEEDYDDDDIETYEDPFVENRIPTMDVDIPYDDWRD